VPDVISLGGQDLGGRNNCRITEQAFGPASTRSANATASKYGPQPRIAN